MLQYLCYRISIAISGPTNGTFDAFEPLPPVPLPEEEESRATLSTMPLVMIGYDSVLRTQLINFI